MPPLRSERMRTIVALMKAGGLWLDFGGQNRGRILAAVQLLRYLFLLFSTLAVLRRVSVVGLRYMLSPYAAFVPLSIEVTVSSTMVLFKMSEIEKLILQCDKDLCSYRQPWERRIVEEDSKRVLYFSNVVKYGFTLYAIFYCSFQVFVNLYRAIVGNPQRYVQPLIFDSFMDESTERNLSFYTVTAMSFLWVALGIPNTVCYYSTIFYTMSCAITELNIVERYVHQLHNEDPTVDWDLSHIVKKHSQILRIARLQNRSIALPTFISCRITFTISTCFILYLILMFLGKDMSILIFAVVFAFALYSLALVICSTGQFLENQSEQLFEDVKSLPWYLQSVKSRKNYLILLRQTSKTLLFDFGQVTPLNLRCFLQLVNSSFSYLMMIKSFGQTEID